MNRRKFLANAAAITSSTLLTSALPFKIRALSPPGDPDLVIWKGTDYFSGVKKAIEAAGGISRFVPQNSSVGILVNSAFDIKGAYVNPDITISLIEEIMETDPREIVLLQVINDKHWELSSYSKKLEEFSPLIKQVKANSFPSEFNEDDFVLVPEIQGATFLKDAEVVKRYLDVDVFINIPLIKHHGSTLLTGALKNMMGLCTRKTNVGFHLGSGEKNDPGYLGQCIADLNLLRKPDLVVADATELITNNGPFGPGDLAKPDTIIIGSDPVAVDSYGCQFLDFLPEEIHSIQCAYNSGVGEMDLENIDIVEVTS
jgi:uncharacterized protein (DUF362 family)